MKSLFLSRWGGPASFHVTQMGAVIGAEFKEIGREFVGFEGESYDLLIIVTRMVNGFEDMKAVTDLLDFLWELDQRPRIVSLEIEGVDYYELAHLNAQFSLSPASIPLLVRILNRSDLAVTGSETHAQTLRALAPGVNVQVFGFIPEEDSVYEKALASPTKITRRYAFGLGSKVGPGRRGGLDVAAVSAFASKAGVGRGDVLLVPLTGGHRNLYYDALARELGFQITHQPYLKYSNYLSMLAGLDMVVNLDSLAGACRLALECARVKTPCVGTRWSMYQCKYFGRLSVGPSVDEAADAIHHCLLGGVLEAFKEESYALAAVDGRDAHIAEWKNMLRKIGVPI